MVLIHKPSFILLTFNALTITAKFSPMINTGVKKSRFLSVSMVLKAGKEAKHTTKKQVKTLIIKSKKSN
ncbi:hypothetical protein AM629_08115 [Photorhabdus heterorhabditis]|uniref:Uncharacterized protein n=1 Tax=Photorhabdus heterorhabditis TaxID=880156 RepID=A0ABR5KDH2_9GAMM|nr:hypothetical protein AM629_08115 [Photorhabdus heterorhabditis]